MIIEFKPHSGNRRIPAPQRSCGHPSRDTHTKTARLSPEASPEASGQVRDALIGVVVLLCVAGYFWVLS